MFSLAVIESTLHRIRRCSHACRYSEVPLLGPFISSSTSINTSSASDRSCCSLSPQPSLQTRSFFSNSSHSSMPLFVPHCLYSTRLLHCTSLTCAHTTTPVMKSSKQQIDRSLVPELLEKDLVETAIKGWGPGGQAVNKTNNAVFLKHLPTGLFVKVHKHRMLHQNSVEARQMLLARLDDLVNGPRSVSAQKARLLEKRSARTESKGRKMRELKAQWKQAQKDEGEEGLRHESENSHGSIDKSDGVGDTGTGNDYLSNEVDTNTKGGLSNKGGSQKQ